MKLIRSINLFAIGRGIQIGIFLVTILLFIGGYWYYISQRWEGTQQPIATIGVELPLVVNTMTVTPSIEILATQTPFPTLDPACELVTVETAWCTDAVYCYFAARGGSYIQQIAPELLPFYLENKTVCIYAP